MRLEKIILINYRQFRGNEIPFPRVDDRGCDIHVFVGENGTGKTNILNAINWCLYGDEPHLSRDSQQLPVLNLKSLEEASDGEDKKATVEIWTETEDKRYLIITRTAVYRVYKEENRECKLQQTALEVKVSDEKGNTKIFKEDDAKSYVGRFVPRRIREFFFFDGERLDSYFREATAQNIRHAVFEIAGIDLLESTGQKTNTILRELTKEAGGVNPNIEETRQHLEKAEDNLRDIDRDIEGCNRQISIAKARIKESQDKLKEVPDIEVLEKERKELKILQKEKNDLRSEKVKQKQKVLFDYAKILMCYPAIDKSISVIQEKRKNKEIPPTIDKGLLESIVKSGACTICGRLLDEDAEEHVGHLLKNIRLTSDIAHQLLDMERPVNSFGEMAICFENDVRGITSEIQVYEKDLKKMETRINQIDKDLSGYDVAKIREWHKDRQKWEAIHDSDQRKLGSFISNRRDLQKKIEKLRTELDDELKKEVSVKKLKKQIDFTKKALDTLEKTKTVIMKETRGRIESETRKLFFELIWKKKTFQDVTIDDEYNINLIHLMGYECLGSISAGERELLALSFTLALHNVSGFKSPILIDTPVARVSEKHRENFGDVLSKVGFDKQTILLFTGAEYSKDISKKLDPVAFSRYKLKMSSDEKIVEAEVL